MKKITDEYFNLKHFYSIFSLTFITSLFSIIIIILNFFWIITTINEITILWKQFDREIDEIKNIGDIQWSELKVIPVVVNRNTRENYRHFVKRYSEVTEKSIVKQNKRNHDYAEPDETYPTAPNIPINEYVNEKTYEMPTTKTKYGNSKISYEGHMLSKVVRIQSKKKLCSCIDIQNLCKKGLPGQPGKKGLNGYDGMPGIAGIPGFNALSTIDICQTIQMGCISCPSGKPGIPGSQGKRGIKGLNGKDGIPGCSGKHGIPGVPGDQGEPGPIGPPGLEGIQGPPGNIGYVIKSKPGPQGLKGPPGVIGLPGDDGDKGVPGKPGGVGLQGMPGLPGNPGIVGMDGKPGEIGSNGSSGEYCPCPEKSAGNILSVNDKQLNYKESIRDQQNNQNVGETNHRNAETIISSVIQSNQNEYNIGETSNYTIINDKPQSIQPYVSSLKNNQNNAQTTNQETGTEISNKNITQIISETIYTPLNGNNINFNKSIDDVNINIANTPLETSLDNNKKQSLAENTYINSDSSRYNNSNNEGNSTSNDYLNKVIINTSQSSMYNSKLLPEQENISKLENLQTEILNTSVYQNNPNNIGKFNEDKKEEKNSFENNQNKYNKENNHQISIITIENENNNFVKGTGILNNHGYEPNSNVEYESKISITQESNNSTGHESNSNNGYERNINNGYERNINNGHETNINNGYETNINNGYETNINNGYETNSNNGHETNSKNGQQKVIEKTIITETINNGYPNQEYKLLNEPKNINWTIQNNITNEIPSQIGYSRITLSGYQINNSKDNYQNNNNAPLPYQLPLVNLNENIVQPPSIPKPNSFMESNMQLLNSSYYISKTNENVNKPSLENSESTVINNFNRENMTQQIQPSQISHEEGNENEYERDFVSGTNIDKKSDNVNEQLKSNSTYEAIKISQSPTGEFLKTSNEKIISRVTDNPSIKNIHDLSTSTFDNSPVERSKVNIGFLPQIKLIPYQQKDNITGINSTIIHKQITLETTKLINDNDNDKKMDIKSLGPKIRLDKIAISLKKPGIVDGQAKKSLKASHHNISLLHEEKVSERARDSVDNKVLPNKVIQNSFDILKSLRKEQSNGDLNININGPNKIFIKAKDSVERLSENNFNSKLIEKNEENIDGYELYTSLRDHPNSKDTGLEIPNYKKVITVNKNLVPDLNVSLLKNTEETFEKNITNGKYNLTNNSDNNSLLTKLPNKIEGKTVSLKENGAEKKFTNTSSIEDKTDKHSKIFYENNVSTTTSLINKFKITIKSSKDKTIR